MEFIKKITVHYVPVEDRLRLSVDLENSKRCCLWLTARLCLPLVGALFKAGDLSMSEPDQRGQPLQQSSEVNSFRHVAAVTALQQSSSPAVRIQAVDEHHLIQALHLRRNGQGLLILQFQLPEDEAAQIVFTPPQLRQWLHILYNQCHAARWPAEVWPSWFVRANRESRSSPTVKVLH